MATTYEKVSTSKPKDLKIDASSTITNVAKKMSLSASWSCGDDNYSAGQQFFYRWTGNATNPGAAGGKKWSDFVQSRPKGHNSITINKDLRSITFFERNFADFYPNTDQHLRWVRVYVKGQKAKYSKKIKKKTHHYDPQWSDWSERSVHILNPPKPILDDPADGGTDFSKNFAWFAQQTSAWVGEAKADMEKFEIFYDCEWESILINNNNPSDKYSSSSWSISHAGYQGGVTTPGLTSGTISITENTAGWSGYYSYTRYVRIRARGPGGDSSWVVKSFTYCLNKPPDKISQTSTIIEDGSGGYNATIGASTVMNVAYPYKHNILQHCIAVPITSLNNGKVTISVPPDSDVTWVDDLKLPPSQNAVMVTNNVEDVRIANSYRGEANTFNYTFHVDSFAEDDKLVWGRNTVVGLDDTITKGPSSLITPLPGRLPDPSGLTISDISVATHRVTVSATNNSQVEASYLVIYYRFASNPSEKKICGTIMHNESSATVELPDWGENAIDIGVQTVLADLSEIGDTSVKRTYMESDIVWDGGSLPLPPTNLELESPRFGTILATWDWTWKEADFAEVSWADDADAWDSTSQPSTFILSNTNNGKLNITGIGVGTWYVRVRFIKRSGDTETYGMYSATKELVMSSVPTVPYLSISPSIVRPDGSVTLAWLYNSEDASAQTEVQIAKASDLNTPIIKELNGTTLTLSASDLSKIGAWTDGATIRLRVRAKSKAGLLSGWSQEASFVVASPPVNPTLTFTAGWQNGGSVVVGDETLTMDTVISTPIRFNVSGVPSTNNVSVMIIRAKGTVVKRPDESEYPVYAGDVAYRNTGFRGSTTITINQADLIDYLDDGHDYILTVTNTDAYGQQASTEKPFRVVWAHQAVKPEALVEIDRDEHVAFITPSRPASGYVSGDVCDIYRLSVDKPQLIVSNAELGSPPVKYVDLYPTLGEFGGYRVVYKTLNGDYRVDGDYAMTDYSGADEYIIDEFMSIIDFGSDKVYLRYNLSLSNSWKKDFVETKYLGGSIQGDWNPGVSRTGSMNVTVSIQEDPFTDNPEEVIETMRRLAVYPGLCHVRTPDGSSYYANVDVQEDREEKWVTRLAKFSLSITRVDDPGTFEGLKYEDYINNPDEE